jgi:voltage-gated potassium channel
LLNTAVLVVLYYALPLDQPFGTSVVVRVLIGLVLFAGITVWQLRSIIGSPFPAVKAAQVLGLVFPLFLLIFASTYFVMETNVGGELH